jgi:hypothetical protein
MIRDPLPYSVECLRLSFQRLALIAHPAYKLPTVRQVKRLLLDLLADLEAELALNGAAPVDKTHTTPDFMPPLSLADLQVLESSLRLTPPHELD